MGPPPLGTSPALYGVMGLHVTLQTPSFDVPLGLSAGRSRTPTAPVGGPRQEPFLGAKPLAELSFVLLCGRTSVTPPPIWSLTINM